MITFFEDMATKACVACFAQAFVHGHTKLVVEVGVVAIKLPKDSFIREREVGVAYDVQKLLQLKFFRDPPVLSIIQRVER